MYLYIFWSYLSKLPLGRIITAKLKLFSEDFFSCLCFRGSIHPHSETSLLSVPHFSLARISPCVFPAVQRDGPLTGRPFPSGERCLGLNRVWRREGPDSKLRPRYQISAVLLERFSDSEPLRELEIISPLWLFIFTSVEQFQKCRRVEVSFFIFFPAKKHAISERFHVLLFPLRT